MTFLLLLACLQDAPIEDLIAKWRSEDLVEREDALGTVLDRWATWSDEDLAALEKAGKDRDAEVAAKARTVLARIRLRRKLGAALLKGLPGVESALLSGSENARVELLVRAVALWKREQIDARHLEVIAETVRTMSWSRHSLQVVRLCREEQAKPLGALLAGLLKHRDQEVRSSAADAIGFLDLKRYAGDLVPLLSDEEGYLHWEAGDALVALRARGEAPRIRTLLKHASAGVRGNAVRILGELDLRDATADVARLLDDPDKEVRQEAVEALGKFEASEHAVRVAAFLMDPDVKSRRVALTALHLMGARQHAGQIARRLRDPEGEIRQAAVGAIEGLKAEAHWEDVASLLSDPEWFVRAEVVAALGRTGDRAFIPRVVERLGDESDSVRFWALQAVANLGALEHVDKVLPFLEHKEERMRSEAVKALKKLDAREQSDRIAGLLKDPSSAVQSYAVEALGSLGGHRHADAVWELLETDPNVSVRITAAIELRFLGTPRHFGKIGPLLRHPDPLFQGTAGMVLRSSVMMKPESLRSFLTDPLVDVREPALVAWGRIARKEHLKELRKALEDGSDTVRVTAAVELARAAMRLLSEKEREGDRKRLAALSEPESRGGRRLPVARFMMNSADIGTALRLIGVLRKEPLYSEARFHFLEALAREHEADAFERMNRARPVDRRIQTHEDLRTWVEAAGLKIAFAGRPSFFRRIPAGTRLSIREALERIFDQQYSPGIVPDGGVIRVLDGDAALDLWKKKLDGK